MGATVELIGQLIPQQTIAQHPTRLQLATCK
jgi:hypothetical protein